MSEPAADAAARDLWREPDFVRLWGAATVTNFGSMITQLAVPFAAIQVLHATPAELGVLRALVIVPGFALGLFAGSWLDRTRRRPVLIGSDLLRAALYASIAAAAALGRLSMPWLYAVAFAAGVLSFVFHVARDAYLPALVRRDALVSANARLRGGEAASEGAGFGVGGWLVQLLGAPQALLVDAGTFLASAGLLATIRAPEPPPVPRRRARTARDRLREIGEGLRVVLAHPGLRPLALAGALLAASWQTTGIVYLLFLDELGFDAGWLGVVFAAGSVSSLAGSLVARPLGRRLGAGRAMAAGLGVHALSMALVPLVGGPGALGFTLLAAQQLGDGGEVVFSVHGSSYRQAALPLDLQGRAAASFAFLAQGGMLLGTVAGAALGELAGARATLAIGAAGMLGAAAIVAFRGRSSFDN
ncbi:MAG TPA: MFS transporter [Myxococcota bacterium]|nr:MFS transporter [Myxococcota bacterium]